MATLDSVRDRVRAAVAEGDYQPALHLTESIRRHFPRDLETGRLRGQIQLASGRWEEAQGSFAAVLEVDPESVVARAGLALLAEEEGDPDRALEQLERVFDLDGSNSEVAAEICRLRSRSSHSWPVDLGSAQHALARRSLVEKKYERAAVLFQDAVWRAPERLEVAVGLARALWLTRRQEEAERVAAEVLAIHPSCLKMLAILAGASFARGEAEAMFLLRKTDELDPGNRVARRLFLDAGLPFPRVGVDPEVPEAELRGVAGSPSRNRPALEESEAEDSAEEDWEEEEEPEPFFLPEAQLEGEWVRGKREAGD